MRRITSRLSILLICSALSAHGGISNDVEANRVVGERSGNQPPPLTQATGTVVCDGGVRGTATHIAHSRRGRYSVIVTVAHLLFDPDTGKPYEHCHYRPLHQRLVRVDFRSLSAHNFSPSQSDKIAQSEADIVFVALKHPIAQPAMELGIPGSRDFEELSLIGYNAELDRLTRTNDCRRRQSSRFPSQRLLLHDCNAVRGSSGGPLFSVRQNRVVAIHGGTLFIHHSLSGNAPAEPEARVNEARLIDRSVLDQLEEFIGNLP